MTEWSHRPQKDEIRFRALQGYEQRAGAIFLPGWDDATRTAGLCVRKGLAMGALDPILPIYAVEGNPALMDDIEGDLKKLGLLNMKFHRGLLDTMTPSGPVDFSFIDLMGTIEPELLLWMRNRLAPSLITGSHLAITVSFATRGSKFMKQAMEVFRTQFPEMVSEFREHYGVYCWNRLLPLLLVRVALGNYDIRLQARKKYRDDGHMPMMFYKFTEIKRRTEPTGWPTLDEILKLAALVEVERRTGVGGSGGEGGGSWRVRKRPVIAGPTDDALPAIIGERLRAIHGLTLVREEGFWIVEVPASGYHLTGSESLDEIREMFSL